MVLMVRELNGAAPKVTQAARPTITVSSYRTFYKSGCTITTTAPPNMTELNHFPTLKFNKELTSREDVDVY